MTTDWPQNFAGMRPTQSYGLPCKTYGHTGDLGDNERADHATALGTFGLVSSHNLATRWAHHSFDTAACFASCSNIGDVLEKLHDIRTETTSTSQQQYRS